MNEDKSKEVMAIPGPDVEAIDTTAHFLQMAERRAGLIEKVKELGIKATHARDWVDQNGSPYLMGSGAEKVRTRFALRIWNVKTERFNESDAKGDYSYFRVTGKVGFNETEFMETTGTCSTRDQFFSTRHGEPIPQSDVDITNIEKSAYTNFIVNGITRFLGLRNLTWDELEGFGIKKAQAAKVEYKSGKKSSKWTDIHSAKAKRIGNYLLANADGDKKVAANGLEQLTTWKDKEGKEVRGKRSMAHLSGKQIEILWDKLKDKVLEYEGAGHNTDEKQAENGS